MKLRHVRGDKELPSLVNDPNYNVDYQEYRQFQKPINVLPVRHPLLKIEKKRKDNAVSIHRLHLLVMIFNPVQFRVLRVNLKRHRLGPISVKLVRGWEE